jgi:hypothetical protein
MIERLSKEFGQEQLIGAVVGDIGLAVYPGQSPHEVLAIARLVENETDLGPYSARDVARKLLRELAVLRKELPRGG